MSTCTPKNLKIASWNINSVRFRLELVERFLREEQPDILCLQETKVVNNDFPAGMFRQLGYNFHVIHGQPMHHGVAILSKIPIREDLAYDWQDNGEARRSEEHTSELQSLMRISSAVFCLKKKKHTSM